MRSRPKGVQRQRSSQGTHWLPQTCLLGTLSDVMRNEPRGAGAGDGGPRKRDRQPSPCACPAGRNAGEYTERGGASHKGSVKKAQKCCKGWCFSPPAFPCC